MTLAELKETLYAMAKEVHQMDHTQRLADLEGQLDYYRNKAKQDEIKIIRLETRLSDIRNLFNGANDDGKYQKAERAWAHEITTHDGGKG